MAILSMEIAAFVLTAKHVISQDMLPILFLLTIATPFLFGWYMQRTTHVLVVKRIDNNAMWLSGAGQAFLDSIAKM